MPQLQQLVLREPLARGERSSLSPGPLSVEEAVAFGSSSCSRLRIFSQGRPGPRGAVPGLPAGRASESSCRAFQVRVHSHQALRRAAGCVSSMCCRRTSLCLRLGGCCSRANVPSLTGGEGQLGVVCPRCQNGAEGASVSCSGSSVLPKRPEFKNAAQNMLASFV